MRPPGPDRPAGSWSHARAPAPSWRWALVLVGCLHLLTTAGTWSLTDQVEYAFVARRLLDRGSLELAEPGAPRVPELPWLIVRQGEPLRTRMLPATPLTLVPLLALDRWLGLEDPEKYGRLLHLQGHVFVIAGLALLAAAVQAWGASASAAAAAVLLTGLTWPVWLVARRIGPEPILFFLVCLFLFAETWVEPERRRAAGLVRLLVCAALPWVNPTGPVVGLCLATAGFVQAWLAPLGEPEARRVRLYRANWAAAGLTVGVGSQLVVWNRLYHGNWWLGGYAPFYAAFPPLGVRDPVAGLFLHVRAMVLEGSVILLLVLLGLRASRGLRGSPLALAACLPLGMLLFFASFHQPEPARRLAVVWPAFGAVAGRTWDSLKLPAPAPQAVIAAAGLLGFHWLIYYEGRRYPGPGGLFYPNVLWVERLLSGAPAWQLLPAVLLLVAGLVAGARVWRLLRQPPA